MPEAHRLLVADDEAVNRRLMKALFIAEGFEVTLAEGGEEALSLAAAAPPSLVLLDLRMPDLNGLEVLAALRARAPQLPVIVVTSHGDVPAAVEATRLGAYDFLIRPINNDKLVLAVRRALERRTIESELAALRREAQAGDALQRLRGLGPAMQQIVERIRSVASSPLTVLLQGETGTGKEVVARAVHQESDRRNRPFVALDCGAIPEGLLESELFGHEKGAFSGALRRREGQLQLAEGGTLFLDEVANFTIGTQAKLLRVIQERKLLPVGGSQPIPVDVRLIAATNQSLDEQVRRGQFRQDLYFRLAEFVISLPTLRERKEDVLTLARRFLEDASLELRRPASTFSPEAAAALEAHAWPGNVRELRNAVRQATLSATGVTIELSDLRHLLGVRAVLSAEVLPVALAGSLREIAAAATAAAERQAITEAMRLAGGNKAEAARILKTDYKTLYLKLKRYGLQRQ
jgi:DNA-binding NtrC family response regulator